MDICWLAADGDFDGLLLSPGVNYEVVFILTMKDFSHGWDNIVTLRLERPDNTEHEEEIILDPEEFKGQWGGVSGWRIQFWGGFKGKGGGVQAVRNHKRTVEGRARHQRGPFTASEGYSNDFNTYVKQGPVVVCVTQGTSGEWGGEKDIRRRREGAGLREGCGRVEEGCYGTGQMAGVTGQNRRSGLRSEELSFTTTTTFLIGMSLGEEFDDWPTVEKIPFKTRAMPKPSKATDSNQYENTTKILCKQLRED
ncbi:hypothetical protein QJS10_CPA10g02024 [Acorus calamus]|uniref:Uncharacterized protein n=1 Tax=Acorus calamus TaxID=4465 RepID=A0AAV9E2S4_ACOCL|nr:hypothetical protein QJS10_CPA10g02024 [Acorus calamus]